MVSVAFGTQVVLYLKNFSTKNIQFSRLKNLDKDGKFSTRETPKISIDYNIFRTT